LIYPFTASRTPIGVDFGAKSVRAVQLRRDRGRVIIEAATCFDIPETKQAPDARTIEQLGNVLKRQGFRGNRIVLAAPQAITHTDLIDLPNVADNAPIAQLTRMEVVRTHQINPGTFELACAPLPRSRPGGRGVNVFTVTCPHEAANGLLNAVEADGLRVEALEPETFAIGRAAALSAGKLPADRIVLNLGWSAARIIAIHLAQPLYQRCLDDLGMHKLHQRLTAAAEGDAEVAQYLWRRAGFSDESTRPDITRILAEHVKVLVEELGVSMNYFKSLINTENTATLLLCGQGAAMPGLAEAINRESRMDVHVLRPSAIAECPDSLKTLCGDPQLTTAMGLALHGREAA